MFLVFSSPRRTRSGGLLNHPRQIIIFLANSTFIRRSHGGKIVHEQISINTQIRSCMRNGLVDLAQKLFDEAPRRDTITWNSMIRGYFQNGEFERAAHLFDQMPDRDIFSFNTMIAGLMQCSDTDGAKQVFDRMPARDVVSWNSMIVGYVRHSMMEEALMMFEEMPERNTISWNTLMVGLVNSQSFELSELIFDQIPVKDIASWTIMISALANMGRIVEARRLFEQMPDRDIRAWNTMIAGYIDNGRIEIAAGLFVKMPERDLNSWNELVDGLVGSQHLSDALKFFSEMPYQCPHSWNSILVGLVRSGLVREAHSFFVKNPFSNCVAWTNMIVGYFEIRNVHAALELFEATPNRDETLWNATIFGLGENDCSEEGLKLFLRMKGEGWSPDHATFTSILNICSVLPSLHFGKQVHGDIIKSGFDHFVAVSNAIVTMYARCGSIFSAHKVFSCMHSQDTISWNSIICGFSQHGKAREALKFFEKMRLAEFKPDQVTFIGVFSACSHAGLIGEGLRYFNLMRYKCFLQPTCEHYTCIVDLLGRSGFVGEAMKFIDILNADGIEVSASMWGALLGACRIHRNIEVGEIAGKRVLEMEPGNAGAYTILAEMYLAVGKEKDAEMMWAFMKERGVKKQPGCSWIEVKNRVDVFLAGDDSHPEINSVYGMLDLMNGEMEIYI